MLDALENFGELHRQIDALADLLHALGVGLAVAQALELVQQQFEVAGDEPMSEFGVDARAREVVVRHQRDCAHLDSQDCPSWEMLARCRCSWVRSSGLLRERVAGWLPGRETSLDSGT